MHTYNRYLPSLLHVLTKSRHTCSMVHCLIFWTSSLWIHAIFRNIRGLGHLLSSTYLIVWPCITSWQFLPLWLLSYLNFVSRFSHLYTHQKKSEQDTRRHRTFGKNLSILEVLLPYDPSCPLVMSVIIS